MNSEPRLITGGKKLNKASGYIYVYIGRQGHRSNYASEHTILAENILGRRLKKGEVVHHLNGDKTDNRNCNLLICTQKYHNWLHWHMSLLYQQERFGTCTTGSTLHPESMDSTSPSLSEDDDAN